MNVHTIKPLLWLLSGTTACCMFCAVCCTPCVLCSVVFAVCCAQCVVCCAQCVVRSRFSVLCIVCSMLCVVGSVFCAVPPQMPLVRSLSVIQSHPDQVLSSSSARTLSPSWRAESVSLASTGDKTHFSLNALHCSSLHLSASQYTLINHTNPQCTALHLTQTSC